MYDDLGMTTGEREGEERSPWKWGRNPVGRGLGGMLGGSARAGVRRYECPLNFGQMGRGFNDVDCCDAMGYING